MFGRTCGASPHLLVVMCNFTKYIKLIAVKAADGLTTAKVLFYQVFMTFGFPKKLLSDRGSHFLNETMDALTKIFEIHKINTSPYNPQSDGANENSHRMILKILRILIEKKSAELEPHVSRR